MTRQDRIAALKAAAKERILILDGSWGVMIQRKGLEEADFLGERFKGHNSQMKGNNDILCLTRPDIVDCREPSGDKVERVMSVGLVSEAAVAKE